MTEDRPKPRSYRLYGIFNHPVRAKILELLNKGPTSFTQLKKETQVSVGSLYYHLSVLGEVISQDSERKYVLNELGTAALKHLETSPFGGDSPPKETNISLLDKAVPIVSGSIIFQGITLSPMKHLVEWVLIMILGAWVSYSSNLDAAMLFLFEGGSPPIIKVARFLVSWLAIYSISNVFSMRIFKSRGGNLSLIICSAYSLLPLTVFALVWSYLETIPSVLDTFGGWPLRILFFVLQAWSLLLLSSALRVSKNLTATGAFVTVLLLVYVNIGLIFAGNIP